MSLASDRRECPGQSVLRRVALVTCKELPGLDEDTRRLIAPLAARGMAATPAIWDDPEVDWNGFDLVVVRSCWDYVSRRNEFLEWATRVPNLANPAAVLAWNTHKGYLRELADRDVPIVPTRWLPPSEKWTPPESGDWVIKPVVSLASLDTGRYRMDDRNERRLAFEHVRRVHAEGPTVMLQPYMRGIDDEGVRKSGITGSGVAPVEPISNTRASSWRPANRPRPPPHHRCPRQAPRRSRCARSATPAR